MGLYDEAAFDLSAEILPTSYILSSSMVAEGLFTALEEWREEYDAQLAARKCPSCGDHRGEMVVCDQCGEAWHLRCAQL